MAETATPPSFTPHIDPFANPGGSPVYVVAGMSLVVSVMNAAAGVTLKVTGRTLAVGDTKPSPLERLLVPATDRSVSTATIPLTDGWLINAEVSVSAGSPLTGQCYARLSINQGTTTLGPELWSLQAGYATAKKPVSYPGALWQDSLDGGGALRSIVGTTPAAGAEILETVPTGARWELIALAARFVAGGAAANRFFSLTLDDGTANPFARLPCNATATTAGQTVLDSWIQGGPNVTAQTGFNGALPVGNRLPAAGRIRTVTTGIQAADQWDQVQYLVKDWHEGA